MVVDVSCSCYISLHLQSAKYLFSNLIPYIKLSLVKYQYGSCFPEERDIASGNECTFRS